MTDYVFTVSLRNRNDKQTIDKLEKEGYEVVREKGMLYIKQPKTDELFWKFFDLEL